ncbi:MULTISPECIES: baseplate assembly protein [unclassified Saccharibacter]|uniref:baseplate assembly protein n=1 Tax=unclassified Saccharibacter TaxID=2648722 RepID=UPI0013545369|nr:MULTISPECIES: baseplate assembly protein [unclassified Saccharibacter]MXV58357.1 baseplate assembly protein [Saccharibacter sp. EH70]MXV65801.1 baseplate assembly protein [Saccharibacter sp. EH60]
MPSPHANSAPYTQHNTTPHDIRSSLNALIESHISQLGTPVLVRVETVQSSGVSLTGKVDVLPLTQQQDRLRRPYTQHIIRNVPYLRIQGGTSALIIDPKPGDIGFIVIAGRDQTNVVAARSVAPPASFRQFSISDCVYVGGFLNEAPNQYVQFTDEGVRIVSPGKVEIEAASISANCDITTTGDVTAGNISLKGHTHDGVQPGKGISGKPQ